MPEQKISRRAFLQRAALVAGSVAVDPPVLGLAAEVPVTSDYPVAPLEPLRIIRQRAAWKQFTILVWQYKNDVRRDFSLYEKAGLRGFHIDRGAGAEDRVRFSLEKKFPYYVDHAAGKGILFSKKMSSRKFRARPPCKFVPIAWLTLKPSSS